MDPQLVQPETDIYDTSNSFFELQTFLPMLKVASCRSIVLFGWKICGEARHVPHKVAIWAAESLNTSQKHSWFPFGLGQPSFFLMLFLKNGKTYWTCLHYMCFSLRTLSDYVPGAWLYLRFIIPLFKKQVFRSVLHSRKLT